MLRGSFEFSMMHYLPRMCRGPILGVLLLAAVPFAAKADTLNAHYAVTLIGLPFGSINLSETLEPANYHVELSTRLTGLASLVSSARGVATATGALPDNRVRPATYATTSSNSSETRTTRMTIVNNNLDKSEMVPPWGPFPDQVPLGPADTRGVIDPLSSIIIPVPGTGDVTGPAACNRSIPIYDGGTRFDIDLAYVGARQVKTKGYEGPVAVCAVRYKPISGHRANRAGTRFMADNKQIEAWLAPVGQSRILAPYRVSVLTMIGTVVIEATDFEGSGQPHPVKTKR